jgi:hypothetical protein
MLSGFNMSGHATNSQILSGVQLESVQDGVI